MTNVLLELYDGPFLGIQVKRLYPISASHRCARLIYVLKEDNSIVLCKSRDEINTHYAR